MKVVTINAWHGLTGAGVYRFGEIEPVQRREQRWAGLVKLLATIDADIVFLQELNPLSQRLENLGAAGFCCHGATDQSGFKAFGFGIPVNLSTGIGLATSQRVDVEFVRRIQLSGKPWCSGETFSLQLGEIRVAQMAVVRTERLGRLLLLHTHLHHGFEADPSFRELVQSDQSFLSTQEREILLEAAELAKERRLHELRVCVDQIERCERALGKFDGLILAGDLNASPESAVAQALASDGWTDLAASQGLTNPTWDPLGNSENHKLQRGRFKYSLPAGVSSFAQKLYEEYDQRPRRIDYIWSKGTPAQKVARAKLFGDKPLASGVYISDHFGLELVWGEG